MRLCVATVATTVVLLLVAALVAEPVAAHGLRSSSSSSSSSAASGETSQAALHEARAQQQQAEVDVAALPEGVVFGLMEADKGQELAMAKLHDALVASLQGQGAASSSHRPPTRM